MISPYVNKYTCGLIKVHTLNDVDIIYSTMSEYTSSQRQIFIGSSTSPSSHRIEEYLFLRRHTLSFQIDVETCPQPLYLRRQRRGLGPHHVDFSLDVSNDIGGRWYRWTNAYAKYRCYLWVIRLDSDSGHEFA